MANLKNFLKSPLLCIILGLNAESAFAADPIPTVKATPAQTAEMMAPAKASSPDAPLQRSARIYDIKRTSGEPRFIQQLSIESLPTGEKKWSSKTLDAQGEVVMTEIATVKGTQVIYQYMEQFQTKEIYELSVTEKQATFKTFKMVDGKIGPLKETKVIELTDEFISGPVAELYLEKNWQKLMDSKSIEVDFAIFEVSKMIAFKFIKYKETETTIELKMKPSSFFISLLVDNIYIEFDKKEKKVIHFKGRTPLREMIDGKLVPMDAEIIYN